MTGQHPVGLLQEQPALDPWVAALRAQVARARAQVARWQPRPTPPGWQPPRGRRA